jgi:hypothetical protein
MYRPLDREQVVVRHAHRSDAAALERLAVLDSGSAPAQPALVAESQARILAALPLGSGRAIADPFEPRPSWSRCSSCAATSCCAPSRPVARWASAYAGSSACRLR